MENPKNNKRALLGIILVLVGIVVVSRGMSLYYFEFS
jgi:hypothetical protein